MPEDFALASNGFRVAAYDLCAPTCKATYGFNTVRYLSWTMHCAHCKPLRAIPRR